MRIVGLVVAATLVLWMPVHAAQDTVRIVAAGDIACDPAHRQFGNATDPAARCHSAQTAALISAIHPDAVLPLGDLQYFGEDERAFEEGYGATWGAFKRITHPAVGNHEYEVRDASGYFDYWGVAAGPRGQGWYSWDLGAWHFIALNANCWEHAVGGCGKDSEQYRWLLKDLRGHPRGCRLAYWHEPRFSTGPHGNDSDVGDFWKALYAAHVDVVLTGHDHNYERFVPMDPSEHADPSGIREFVVGTGGRNHSQFFYPPHPESVTRQNTAFGVLLMTLWPDRYSWEFVPEAGAEYHDRGSAVCHSRS